MNKKLHKQHFEVMNNNFPEKILDKTPSPEK